MHFPNDRDRIAHDPLGPGRSRRALAAATLAGALLVGALLAFAPTSSAQTPAWLTTGAERSHTWPVRGGDAARSSYTSLAGPEDASILPPWPFVAGGDIASSAVIDRRQHIYVGASDGGVYALRPASSSAGLVAWRFDAGAPVIGSPGLSLNPDGLTLVYAATEAGIVHALREDGSVRWQLDLGAPVVSSLAVVVRGVDTWLYLKAGKDLVAVEDDVAANVGSVVWRQALTSPPAGNETSPALVPDGSWVAVTDAIGELSIFNAVGGTPYCNGVALGGTPTTPVVDADGFVYVGIDDAGQGRVESWEIAGFGCQQRFAKPVAGPIRVAPTLAPGELLIAQDGVDLIGLERTNGSVRWREPAGWSGSASAVADGADRLYVPGNDRRMYAFRIESGGLVPAWQLLTDQIGKMAPPAIDALGRLVVTSRDQRVYVLQALPAFMVGFGSDIATVDLEIHTLREIYGEIDPVANPWARGARLTERPADDTQPAYAVDATLLAWSATDGGPADIVLAASGGGEAVPVTDDDGSGVFSATSWETDPAFSPIHPSLGSRLRDGGLYLAMTADNGDGKDLLFLDLARLPGGRRVEDLENWLGRQFAIPLGDPRLAQLVPAGEQRAQPAFAPDGSALAYSACRRIGPVSELYMVTLDLGQQMRRERFPTQVAEDCPAALERGFAPAFSPDGAHIAYHLYGGGLRIHAGSGASILLPDPGGSKPLYPSWSPDGTELVAGGDAGGFSSRPRTLYVYQGQRYQDVSPLTAPLAAVNSVFDAPEHHPARFPEPLLDVDCRTPGGAPPLIVPAAARPGETVEIYGCGFDIKVPERQTALFVHALDTDRFVAGEIRGSRVDVDSGLGVLEVEVPYLAGNGPVGIATAFGHADTGADPADCRDTDSTNDDGCFVVRPLTVALWQPETVIGAQIRVAGYGLQIVTGATSPDPRLDRVFFTDPAGNQTVAAEVGAVRLEACGSATLTPCPPGAPIDADGQPRVAWLEVTVPDGAVPGPVAVIGPGAAAGHACCSLGFLTPTVSVTPDNGSQGNGGAPTQAGGPTIFDMSGEGFPFDPYFDYVRADLAQISPDRQSGAPLAQAVFGDVDLEPAAPGSHIGTFVRSDLSVLPDATARGGELHMQAVGVNSGARAFTPFRTPLRGLPIIFVPGTSGTFISNTGSSDLPGPCTMSYPAGGNVWMSEGTILKISRPVVGGISVPLPILGCQDYLYEGTALARGNNGPRNPALAAIGPSRVIDEVQLPHLGVLPTVGSSEEIYKKLIDFMRAPTGLGRVPGNPRTGACSAATGNCSYLFPMDWRKDYASQAADLGRLVRAIRANGQPKVVILGHSMGGPVIDYYLRTDFSAEQDVDQIVTFGSGYLGVGLPYRILQKGNDWGLNKTVFDYTATGLELIDPNTTQRLAIDWPTAYWQLPSAAWFDDPNHACDGECWIAWEDEWDVDGDGGCGSERDGTLRSCSGRAASVGGKHRNPASTLNFLRNAEHDGCSDCDGDPSQSGDQINVAKFDTARSILLDGSPTVSRSCQLADGTPHNATMGDWRCGTGGVFYHRVVGRGTETDGRFRFYKTSRCARWEVVAAIGAGVFGGFINPLASLACLAYEERRDVISIDGDSTVPLRSTVGILDRYDDRIWGIEWGLAKEEVEVYDDDPDGFHRNLPNDPRVHALLRDIAGGLITNVSQRPVPIDSGFLPYFRVPRGNPRPAPGTPAFDALCAIGVCPPPPPTPSSLRSGSVPTKQALNDRTSADRLRLTVTGDAAVHIFDDEGRHRGTVSEATLDLASIPGVAFDADRSETRAVLPLGSETGYRLEIRHRGARDAGGAPVEVPVHLRLEGVQDQEVLWLDRFDGLPLLATPVIEVAIDDGTTVPAMTLDALGDATAVAIDVVTLDGEAMGDTVRPETMLSVDDGVLTLESFDEGGAGIDQILYGYDRGQTAARLYEGPVTLPEGVRHVWAYAVDRAGNDEAAKTWDHPDCAEGMFCQAEVVVSIEVVDGVVEPGASLVLRAEIENVGTTALFAPSLRLGLDSGALRIEETAAAAGTCGHFLSGVFCDIETLEKGGRFAVEVKTEVLEAGPVAYRLEALVAEILGEVEGATASGLLGDTK